MKRVATTAAPARSFSAWVSLGFLLLVATLALGARAQIVVTNTNDSGAGSLRAAIEYVNSECAGQQINFVLAGAGPHTISPLTELPALTCQNAYIDGYAQEGLGASMNSDGGGGNDAVIQVILNGASCTGASPCSGITLSGQNSMVRGLAIHSFGGPGVTINTASYARVAGNYIGTDPGGMNAFPNAKGVYVAAGQGYVGDQSFPASSRNLISGNNVAGIYVAGGATARIHGNQIGGNRDGSDGNPNAGPGIWFGSACCQNVIFGNHIRYNTGAGIQVDAGDSVEIRTNSIHGNGGPGIDLGADGDTPNDYGDPPSVMPDQDGGANGFANTPDVASVFHNAGMTSVNVNVTGAPAGKWILIELFSNSSMPATRSGETLIDYFTVQLDSNGFASHTFTVPGTHDNISATASHDECGDACYWTSEFSAAVAATVPSPPTEVTHTNDDLTTGSLRSAIMYANNQCLAAGSSPDLSPKAGRAKAGGSTITFNIPGTGPHVITVAAGNPLPDIQCAFTKIDGYTQPGSSKNTRLDGSNDAVIKIVLDGTVCGPASCNGLRVNGGSSEIHGLSIVNFNRGIVVNAPANVYIRGNHIGYNPFAAAPQGNGTGIYVEQGQATVGGNSGLPTLDAEYSNLITGGAYGIFQFQGTMSVLRNMIGGLPNGGSAGAPAGASVAAVFFANVDPVMTSAIDRNYIRHNGGAGVIATGSGMFVARENLIYNNTGHAIDLGFDGPTANDDGAFDADSGPNGRLSYPNITSVVHSGGNTTINAHVIIDATGRPVTFEFFANSSPPTVHQGEVYLGSSSATTVAGNRADVSLTVPGTWNNITATATTDTCGSFCLVTSEYSPAATASAPPTLTLLGSSTGTVGSSFFVNLVVERGASDPALDGMAAKITFPAGVTVQSTTTGCGGTMPTQVGSTIQNSGGSMSGLVTGCSMIGGHFVPSAPGVYEFRVEIGDFTFTTPFAYSNPTVLTWTVTVTAPPPTASLNPSSHSFMGVALGSSSSQPFTLTNTSSVSSMTLTSIGASGLGYTQANDCPAAIPPLGTCTITVTFTPPTTGSHPGTLVVNSNASNSPTTAALVGSGVGTPAVALTPAPFLAFGNVQVGTSSTQNMTITNTGTGDLMVSGVLIVGAHYSVGSAACLLSPIAPGASCNVPVTFAPTAAGTFNASLSISSNAPGSAHSYNASGSGVAPTLSINPSPLDFGTVPVGGSANGSITVTNTSPGAILHVTAVNISGPGFVITTNCTSSTINPGGTCTIFVTVNPTATGPMSATISVTSNASGSPHTVVAQATGTAPGVSLAPTPLNFGNVPLGSNATLVTNLTNTGTAPLAISSIVTSGPGFSHTTTCGTSLPAGQTCPISVTFTPNAAGAQTGTLTVSTNAGAGPVTAPLSGNGATPALSLSTATVTFGPQTVNTQSAPQNVTVTNTGTAPLTISAITITGDFLYTGCATPLTLAAGNSCTLAVKFFPTATGGRAGSITIASNASGSPHNVSLSGTGTPVPVPGITLTPSSHDFGSVALGSNVTHTFSLSNTGTGNLDISGITTTDTTSPVPGPIKFLASHDCPAQLSPSAACSIMVSFSPIAPGLHEGELKIASNAVPSPFVALLKATGFAATSPDVTLSTASLTFSPQFVGTTSAPQTVTVTNSGTAPLVISSVTGTGDFGFSGCGPTTLAPGASCSFSVTFRPFTEGPQTGSLVIASNAAGSPHTITLSGTGSSLVAPEISLNPAAIAFGSVRTGTSVTQRATLTNTGGAVLQISQVAVTGAFFTVAGNTCPASLAVGATCQITIGYSPSATGAHSGQLRIFSNAIPSPHVAALSGTGMTVPPPNLVVDRALDFGQHVTGTTARLPLVLANSGGEALRISTLSITGADGAAFGVEGGCSEIAPEGSCTLIMTFTPTALRSFVARLDIASNHSGGVVQVSLAGQGVALPLPNLSVSVGALGFGTQGQGSASDTRTVTLTSIGPVPITISSITWPPDYQVAHACVGVLASGTTCDLSVRFQPFFTGSRLGDITITTNGATPVYQVNLAGVGCRQFSVGRNQAARLCAP